MSVKTQAECNVMLSLAREVEGLRARHKAACDWVDELRTALRVTLEQRDAANEEVKRLTVDRDALRNYLDNERRLRAFTRQARTGIKPNTGPGATVAARLERLERIIKGHRNIP